MVQVLNLHLFTKLFYSQSLHKYPIINLIQ